MKKFKVLMMLAAILWGCTASVSESAKLPVTEARLGREVVVGGLVHPWGMEFLPDGRLLITERPGRLRILGTDKKLSPPVEGVPPVYAEGQGGLLDVALSPDFASSGLVFLSFSEDAGGGKSRTAVARGRLNGNSLSDVEVIFRQAPAFSGTNHFGSRLVFDRAGNLFVTAGDRLTHRDEVQKLSSQVGKIMRIKPDGSVPADNPFPGNAVWSLGHRNVQGAALNPDTGELWATEHGPQGGDEVNVVRPGKNYGWPIATYGVEYGSGIKIGEGTHKEGMEDPLRVWVPSIAPSGMAFYTASRFPQWTGSLFVAALKFQLLARLTLDGDRIVSEERLIPSDPKRLRDVAQGPDGFLYVLTDEEDGELWRVFPAND